jgi:hypothetical protein
VRAVSLNFRRGWAVYRLPALRKTRIKKSSPVRWCEYFALLSPVPRSHHGCSLANEEVAEGCLHRSSVGRGGRMVRSGRRADLQPRAAGARYRGQCTGARRLGSGCANARRAPACARNGYTACDGHTASGRTKRRRATVCGANARRASRRSACDRRTIRGPAQHRRATTRASRHRRGAHRATRARRTTGAGHARLVQAARDAAAPTGRRTASASASGPAC